MSVCTYLLNLLFDFKCAYEVYRTLLSQSVHSWYIEHFGPLIGDKSTQKMSIQVLIKQNV